MYITKIKLENVRCFTDVTIDLSSDKSAKKWLVIVGNNGVGKTSFLSSIAMGLCDATGAASLLQDTYGDWIRKGEREAIIAIDLIDKNKTYTLKTVIHKSPAGSEIIVRDPDIEKEFPWGKVFVCAYGANRSVRGDASHETYSSADAVYTLFNYDYPTQNPELMLYRRARHQKKAEKEICEWLDDILLLDKGSVKLTDSGIAIEKSGFNIHWGSIADGYEATITLVLDMLGWALLAGQKGRKNLFSGIVMIDEIEQHLHPELQRHIIKKLHDNFPDIQFIASSHSPICAAGLADLPDEKCSLELLTSCEKGFVTNEPLSTMRGWRYDQILRSSAFGTPDRNEGTELRMNDIRKLYMKESLNKKEEKELQELLDKLSKEIPEGAEAVNMEMTRNKIKRIIQELGHEDDQND